MIPGETDRRLGEGTPEGRKMLAFAEFLLRHEMEHALYPDSREGGVIRSDVEFAMERRSDDPALGVST